MLRVLTLFMLFFSICVNVNADFRRLSRNGRAAFFYSDDEMGNNRKHILVALGAARDAIQAKKNRDALDPVKMVVNMTPMKGVFDAVENFSRTIFDPFAAIMMEELKRAGIGRKGSGGYDEEEVKAWYWCSAKNNPDLQKGIQTDINWILGGDPRKGITLYWHPGQEKWHIDRH